MTHFLRIRSRDYFRMHAYVLRINLRSILFLEPRDLLARGKGGGGVEYQI